MNQPQISACAVVPLAQLPVAVLVAPQGREAAESAISSANRTLAEFQRIHQWYLWPDADLPRTSTGKIRRGAVTEWARNQLTASTANGAAAADPLLSLIQSISATPATKTDDTARLAEDLNLDSLGRLQLQSAIEQRFGIALSDESLLLIQTLGQLRAATTRQASQIAESPQTSQPATRPSLQTPSRPIEFNYPRWPWSRPVLAFRIAFIETILRPIVWLLLKPTVQMVDNASIPSEPMLLIANHITFFDAALVLYCLPRRLRDRVAIASAGEMLEDWRHARNQPHWWQNVLGPLQYWVVTALFNIFPLPRQASVRRSFAHIGEALDRGYHVLIFPEGRRSDDGALLPFRSGIGVVAQDSNAPVLTIAIKGLDQLIARKRRWFHSGAVQLRVAPPIRLDRSQRPEDAALALHGIMQNLLQ